MAKECSFDIVSKVDMNEVRNAVNMAVKEMTNRFDFKGSSSSIELEAEKIILHSDDEGKLRQVIEMLEGKLVKREVALKALNYGKVEDSLGGKVRQDVTLTTGIASDKAKEISKLIRDSKIKVQPRIEGDTIRVVGKNKDDLQSVIGLLKEKDLGIPLQYVNYR